MRLIDADALKEYCMRIRPKATILSGNAVVETVNATTKNINN